MNGDPNDMVLGPNGILNPLNPASPLSPLSPNNQPVYPSTPPGATTYYCTPQQTETGLVYTCRVMEVAPLPAPNVPNRVEVTAAVLWIVAVAMWAFALIEIITKFKISRWVHRKVVNLCA